MFDPGLIAEPSELAGRLEQARRRALPLPWAPPMPEVDWWPYRRVHRPLVAEAVAARLRGVVPALRSVDPRLGMEAGRLVRLLDAIADAA